MELKTAKWEQIKELFETALEVEPSSRLRHLERECSSAELRNMVEELLLAHEEAGSFLGRGLKFAELSHSAAMPNRLMPGNLLVERFQILRFIAKGGMGEVYEALDLELDSHVAIKTIRPEIVGSPQTLRRFKQEVQLAKQVTHLNVCRIFDLFRHRDSSSGEGDVLFVSMELLRGQTLAERLKESGPLVAKMSAEEVLLILRQVAAGLGAAHGAGILHRDLKPGNILFEQTRQDGQIGNLRAVITDFGLARSLDSSANAMPTGSGLIAFGTPEYMSPEQIQGRELTPASDLYSLGLMIYQMVTGVRAFAGDPPLLAALRRLNESPPPPSQIVPKLGRQWDAAVAGCLHPDPAQRFASAQQLLETLDGNARLRARTSDLTLLTKHGAPRPPSPFSRRWILGLSALAGCLIAAAGVLLYLHGHRKPAVAGSLTIVLADFVNTTGEPMFDNTLNIALAAKLQQSPFLSLMPGARIGATLRYMGLQARERLTETLARQVCQRGGGQAVLQGSIANSAKGYMLSLRAVNCQSGGLIAVKQAPVEFRDSVLDALDQITEAMRPSLGESLDSIHKYDVALTDATTSSIEALTAFTQGTDKWNQQGEAAALPYFLRATQIDPNFALAWARLGTIYGNIGETQRADDTLRNAYDRRDRATEWERYYIVSHYYGFVTGEIDKEMRAYEEWAKAYPHDMAWTVNLSVDYGFTGQFDKAIELQRRAIQETPGLSPAYGDLAQFYLAVDRPDEARAVLDQALQAHVQDVNTQLGEYELAFYRNDLPTMKKLLAGAAQFPGVEDTLLAQQAATEDRQGRLSSGREFAARAAAVASHAGESEASANWLAAEAVRQAKMGAGGQARRLVAQALAIPNAARGSDVQVLAALASTETGDLKRAEKLLDTVAKARPLDTLIQTYWAPILRARIAFAQGKFAQAVHAVDGTGAYDLGIFTPGQCMDGALVRGQALLADRQSAAAATEFRSVLAHRGLVLNCPTGALAQLGLARALAASGDSAASRTAYQDLFAIWKDADKDFIPLRQAQAEYRDLR
jgi:serine/threonine protein kinase/tetratricopeptide (TPR) repeat protein